MIREGTALAPGASPPFAAASVVPLIVGSLPDRMIPDPAGYVAICVDRAHLSREHYRTDGVSDLVIEDRTAAEVYAPCGPRKPPQYDSTRRSVVVC